MFYLLIYLMNIILACDKNYGIGKNNGIPWHFTEDFQYFKNMTLNKTIIMGYNTWKSLNEKELPLRKNIIVMNNITEIIKKSENLYFYNIIDIIDFIKNTNETVYIIGGNKLISTLLNYFNINKLYLTKIHGEFECDTFINIFENLENIKIINLKKCINKKDNKEYLLEFLEYS